jgi:uncharacterized protein (DUF305 family)
MPDLTLKRSLLITMKIKWLPLGLLFAATASAQMDMSNMNMSSSNTKPADSKYMQAMQTGMTKMDHDMSGAAMNGNPDHDFVTMMIPHHQGAIDMAKVELTYGKDPAMRKLAEDIIAAQKKEIAEMNAWLKTDAAKAAK